MAWSPYKDSVISYVSRHPGCCKWDVARHVTHNGQRCPSKQYYIVNTALRNGWIAGQQVGRSYRLYVPTEESRRKVRERAERRPPKVPEPGRITRLAAERRRAKEAAQAKERQQGILAGARALGLDLRAGGINGYYSYVPGAYDTFPVPVDWQPFLMACQDGGARLMFADYLDEHHNGGPKCQRCPVGATEPIRESLADWIRQREAQKA